MKLIQIRLGFINLNHIVQIVPDISMRSDIVESWNIKLVNGDEIHIDKTDLSKILKASE